MDYVISWFYSENDELKSHYPQVNMDSASSKFQEVYWKCIVSFYTSSLAYNPGVKHILYTNVLELPRLKKFDLKKFFEKNLIEIRFRELSNKTPADWYSAWRNQFYVFDILEDLKGSVSDDDNILILDSDCIITKNLKSLFQETGQFGALLYVCDYNDAHIINGVSIEDMRILYLEYYQKNEPIKYYGGEFIAVRGDLIPEMIEEYNKLWELNYKKYESNLKKLTEEAHFLSFIYHRLNLVNRKGNDYIKRLWNARVFNNIEQNDTDLAIYHLPAQKTTGFKYYFHKAVVRGKCLTKRDLINIFDIKSKKALMRNIREINTKILLKIF